MPMCDLPMPVEDVLAGVDAVIPTHLHSDHIDMTPEGIGGPIDKLLPIFVQNEEN